MGKFQELNPKEFYNKFSQARQDYENRAEEISAYTLPYMMMPDGSTSSSNLADKISQSYCGRLVNTLKAKMGNSLLPASTSSFRLEPDKEALEILTEGDAEAKSVVYTQLSSWTGAINREIEAQQIRDTLFDMLNQMIIIGSVVIEKIKDDGIKLYSLRSFTVDLDSRGEARAICVVEKKKDLPEGIVPEKEAEEYNLYTLIERNNEDGKWYMRQSIEDYPVGEEAKYTDETLPFQYVGWTWTEGDKYHRPYAEDYLPDIKSYNSNSDLLLKGSIASGKIVFFVDEKGNRTRKADVANSKNGAVVNGRADDVTVLQVQKSFDFKIVAERLQDLGKNLAAAFLMNESVTRDAERVTAQEIRFMAQELESSSLSGIYSKLSKKVSKRIVTWVMQELNVKFQGIDVNVVTGLDALGRSQELQRLDEFVTRAANMNMMAWINEAELVQRQAALIGIDTTGLIKTPNQVAQERQQAAQAQAEQTGIDSFAQQAGQTLAQPQQ